VRSTTAIVAALAAATIATVPAASAAAAPPPTVRASQDLATLATAHAVRAAPRAGAAVKSVVAAFRPITGSATVLPVTGRRTSSGRRWLRVRLPGRPNSSQGWIAQAGTSLRTTAWHLVVRASTRRVIAYRSGRPVRSFSAIVGKPSTPSPRGRFFVEESIDMPPGAVGGPYALATSARSNVLQEFAGGPGQIGIHGVENLGGTPGTAVSHGCVRLTNAGIGWLVVRIRPGTPVTISA